jgi:hypothetical protein
MADEALYDEFGECVPAVSVCNAVYQFAFCAYSIDFRYIGPGIDEEDEDDALEAAFNATAARAAGTTTGGMDSGSEEEEPEARATSTAVVLHEDKKCTTRFQVFCNYSYSFAGITRRLRKFMVRMLRQWCRMRIRCPLSSPSSSPSKRSSSTL